MEKILEQAKALQAELVERRRDLHMHPETGWTEFRTASMVIKELQALGYEVSYGDDVIVEAEMMGLPSEDVLEKAMERAINDGADPKLVEAMSGGKTAVMGVMRFANPGKTIGMRFDMDCNDVGEDQSPEHLPAKEGFCSKYPNAMHACGHDGHVSVGLAVAKLVAENKESMSGAFKIYFQPAEEGVRGARAMVAKGIVDDVDYFFGGHIGFKADKENSLICVTGGLLATTKLDANFKGRSSHAGLAPQDGKNALLASAAASVALHSISRHGAGASRINVGVLQAGTGRNVLPDVAVMKLETRGANTEINEYMVTEAKRMINAASMMYNTEVVISEAGGAPACEVDMELGAEVGKIAKATGIYEEVIPFVDFGGSEDCSYFMERVQQKGGRAIYMGYGTSIKAGHHNKSFDFDESCMWETVGFLTKVVEEFGKK